MAWGFMAPRFMAGLWRRPPPLCTRSAPTMRPRGRYQGHGRDVVGRQRVARARDERLESRPRLEALPRWDDPPPAECDGSHVGEGTRHLRDGRVRSIRVREGELRLEPRGRGPRSARRAAAKRPWGLRVPRDRVPRPTSGSPLEFGSTRCSWCGERSPAERVRRSTPGTRRDGRSPTPTPFMPSRRAPAA